MTPYTLQLLLDRAETDHGVPCVLEALQPLPGAPGGGVVAILRDLNGGPDLTYRVADDGRIADCSKVGA